MLLLPRLMRLSTDIDIIVDPSTDVKEYIEKAAGIFPFVSYEEQVRVGKNNIVKRHFKFTYFSPVRQEDFYILLDILYEENYYAVLEEKEIRNELLLTEGDNLTVQVPSIDCILGDKFTAFAPYTTGVPLRAKKNLEVMKQFYDIGTLINEQRNFVNVLKTYKDVVASEINYRGINITAKDVLEDTISAAIIIGSRGKDGRSSCSAHLVYRPCSDTSIQSSTYLSKSIFHHLYAVPFYLLVSQADILLPSMADCCMENPNARILLNS